MSTLETNPDKGDPPSTKGSPSIEDASVASSNGSSVGNISDIPLSNPVSVSVLSHPSANLKSQWRSWLVDISLRIQPLLTETIIFTVFILGDILIIWLVRFAVSDVLGEFPMLSFVYDGIKIASLIVITIHYVVNCIVEVRKKVREVR